MMARQSHDPTGATQSTSTDTRGREVGVVVQSLGDHDNSRVWQIHHLGVAEYMFGRNTKPVKTP